MKKNLIIITLTIASIFLYSSDAKAGFLDGFSSGDSGVNNTGESSGPTIDNTGDSSGPTTDNTGYTSSGYNVMMGGGGDGGAAGAGLANDQPTFEQWSKQQEYEIKADLSNSKVPKASLWGLIYWLSGVMNQLIYVLIGASLVVFLYGIFKLSFVDGQKPESREQSRKFMFWGIVSLFVMVSVWGLVNLLQATFFNGSPLTVPRLK